MNTPPDRYDLWIDRYDSTGFLGLNWGFGNPLCVNSLQSGCAIVMSPKLNRRDQIAEIKSMALCAVWFTANSQRAILCLEVGKQIFQVGKGLALAGLNVLERDAQLALWVTAPEAYQIRAIEIGW